MTGREADRDRWGEFNAGATYGPAYAFDRRDQGGNFTREQVALSTLISDGLMDGTGGGTVADRADQIVRWLLTEPDVVLRALGATRTAWMGSAKWELIVAEKEQG